MAASATVVLGVVSRDERAISFHDDHPAFIQGLDNHAFKPSNFFEQAPQVVPIEDQTVLVVAAELPYQIHQLARNASLGHPGLHVFRLTNGLCVVHAPYVPQKSEVRKKNHEMIKKGSALGIAGS